MLSKNSKEYCDQYYLRNKIKILAKNRIWNYTHKKRCVELARKRYLNIESKKPIEIRAARMRAKRQKLIVGLGGKCVRCGFNDYRALHVDHINGDGYSERANKNGYWGSLSAKSIEETIAGKGIKYQLLCANCNCIKRSENNEHRKPSIV